MKAFTMIYKDEEQNISYYYDMNYGFIYSDKNKNSNLEPKKWAKNGVMIGILINLLVCKISLNMEFSGTHHYWLAIFIGLLLALPMVKWMVSSIEKQFFIDNNRVDADYELITRYFYLGKKFRRKLNIVFLLMFIVSSITTYVFMTVSINFYFYFIVIMMWFVLGYIFMGHRPICYLKFRMALKKGVLYMN